MEKFLKALNEHPELLEELKKQTTEDGLYEVAKPYIGDLSKSDFVLSLRGLFSVGEKLQSGELSDEDLETASGGLDDETVLMGFMLLSSAIKVGSNALAGWQSGKSGKEIGQQAAADGIKEVGDMTNLAMKMYMDRRANKSAPTQ